MFNICLLFHSAKSDNLGVTALTVAQVDLLRRIASKLKLDLKITLLSWADPREPVISGPDIEHVDITGRDMVDPRGALAYLRRSDLILDIGAGDSFSDIYGMKRFRRMIWMKNLARISGTPVVLAPQTFGPFKSRIAKFWAARTIRPARLVAARDVPSVKCLANMGVGGPICLASDVALQLPADLSHPKLHDTGHPRIGINVSGLLWNGGYEQNNQFGLGFDYKTVMRSLVRRLVALPERPDIWLVPHVISSTQKVEDDLSACQDLALGEPGVHVGSGFMHPSSAKAFIANLDFFVGARMHACIAAFSSGVPVMPMAYSRKFAGLFGSLGYHQTLDCRSLQAKALEDAVVSGFESRVQMKEEVAGALQTGLRRLRRFEVALEQLVAECASVGNDWHAPQDARQSEVYQSDRMAEAVVPVAFTPETRIGRTAPPGTASNTT